MHSKLRLVIAGHRNLSLRGGAEAISSYCKEARRSNMLRHNKLTCHCEPQVWQSHSIASEAKQIVCWDCRYKPVVEVAALRLQLVDCHASLAMTSRTESYTANDATHKGRNDLTHRELACH
jgi:hypothetical protein